LSAPASHVRNRKRTIAMGIRWSRLAQLLGSTGLAILGATLANATTIDVAIDTSPLIGDTAVFAFDFIDGGQPDNNVTLSTLVSDGTPSSTSTTGSVSGTGPWQFSDAGSSFFNELLVTFSPMGSSLSFSLTTSNHLAGGGSLPDAFSMFVFDASGIVPLITTDDPTGANAVFLFDIGQGFGGMNVYTAAQAGFSVSATAVSPVPEPGPLPLLLAATAAWLVARWLARRH